MELPVRVIAYGSLAAHLSGSPSRGLTELDLVGPSPPAEVLRKIHLPPHALQPAMVNHKAVQLTTLSDQETG